MSEAVVVGCGGGKKFFTANELGVITLPNGVTFGDVDSFFLVGFIRDIYGYYEGETILRWVPLENGRGYFCGYTKFTNTQNLYNAYSKEILNSQNSATVEVTSQGNSDQRNNIITSLSEALLKLK